MLQNSSLELFIPPYSKIICSKYCHFKNTSQIAQSKELSSSTRISPFTGCSSPNQLKATR
ncbi:hypothetical protein KFK09_017241 [Dendrobium nobile]|uniref:Uncharacterized protein n=1 Tax=Dendrobium nobile TaxID=94219 RepID=A0A8T3B1Z7_DENNO|nr:hypothetical protein KFK09_017241 [Dendrobium nobile]